MISYRIVTVLSYLNYENKTKCNKIVLQARLSLNTSKKKQLIAYDFNPRKSIHENLQIVVMTMAIVSVLQDNTTRIMEPRNSPGALCYNFIHVNHDYFFHAIILFGATFVLL